MSTNASTTQTPIPQVNLQDGGQVPVTDFMGSLVNNPSLPQGAAITPTFQQVQQGEEISTSSGQVDAPNIPGAQQTQQAQATLANPQQAFQQYVDQGASQFQASTVDPTQAPQMQAATGQPSDAATVQGQLGNLLNFDPTLGDQVPAWAKGAIRTAQQVMNRRGMGNSSMVAEAITSAMFGAAMPIAQQDAQTNATFELTNVQNAQDAAKTNLTVRTQAMFNNQAFENSARQFNAQSEAQHNQFFANLASEVELFNTEQQNAISQFNTDQGNAMERFRQSLTDARQRFNAGNRLIIDQSNAEWRRNINTANTATANAVNQINAQNLLGLSNAALNNLWQEFRDEAFWAFQASENEASRNHNVAMAAFQRDTTFAVMDEEQRNALANAAGAAFLDVVGGLLSS